MRFSVIIPVYNCEKLLHISIDSIINQTYKDWELILVNDGSSDLSLSLCRNYLKKDLRIKLISQNNSGPSAARNNGLAHAKGEYVLFCDADDFLENIALEKISNSIGPNNYDIIFYGYYDSLMENDSIKKGHKHSYKHSVFKNNSEFKEIYLDLNDIQFTYPVWNKAYRLEFIKKNKAEFPVGVNIAEDFVFNLQIYTRAENVAIIAECLYYYIQHSSSITSIFLKNKIDSAEYVYKYAVNVMSAWNPKVVNYLHNSYLRDINVYINNMFNKNIRISMKMKYRLISNILNKESVTVCINSVKCCSFRNQIIKILIQQKMILLLMLTGKIARLKCK